MNWRNYLGKAIEWSRLDRRGDDDEGYERVTFRKGRLDTLTRWDWVKWWTKYGRQHYVRCAAGECDPAVRLNCEKLAVFTARDIAGSRVCAPARIRLQGGPDV